MNKKHLAFGLAAAGAAIYIVDATTAKNGKAAVITGAGSPLASIDAKLPFGVAGTLAAVGIALYLWSRYKAG